MVLRKGKSVIWTAREFTVTRRSPVKYNSKFYICGNVFSVIQQVSILTRRIIVNRIAPIHVFI